MTNKLLDDLGVDAVQSEGARESFANLNEQKEATLKVGRIAKLYIIEIFLLKALKQHSEGQEDSLRVISRELGVLQSSMWGLGQADAQPSLISLAKRAQG